MHVSYFALVVGGVEHEIGEAFEDARVTLRDVLRPGLFEAVYGR